ncbi:MAG: N-acetylneuraminate lyase [Clostridia bacterium]|jgi:N-acetylneuraminate lyase|nr:N-acetylneuraminate lyase [Clostridia bacterium]
MLYDTSRFNGVIVAFNACYNKNGEIALDAVKKAALWYKELGVKGLYVCGSTGEGFLMETSERKEVLEAVMEAVGDDMTIINHVGHAATHIAADLAKHAGSCGVHATSAVPSVYYRPSEASIERHWNEITYAADVPFFIYNIPQLTGYNLSMNLFNKMIKNERVIGIKNSSESAEQIMTFKQAGGSDFIVFNGPDEQYLAGRMMGADGGIGGTYGCMPELYLRLERCIVAGDIIEAQKWQTIVLGLIKRLVSFPSMYGASKTIIRLRGVDIGDPRLPFLPVPIDYPGIQELYNDIMKYVEIANSNKAV